MSEIRPRPGTHILATTDLNTKAQAALADALAKFPKDELAAHLDITHRTLERWRTTRISNPGLVYHALSNVMTTEFGKAEAPPTDFTFCDLFAGIGGTRLGMERAGGKCVFTCEWDKYSLNTYRANFSLDHPLVEDITTITDSHSVPDHDLLVAGFPCQPFSIAGVSKKNSLGRAHGFACEAQGTLFFEIAKILEAKRPTAFVLENVKNLKSHDKGRTFDVIYKTLTEELGYTVEYRIIDGRAFTPQHRERIFIVGFREPTAFSFDELSLPQADVHPTMAAILHPQDGSEDAEPEFTVRAKAKVSGKYILSQKLWRYLQAYAKKHKAKGNGFGFGLVGPDDVARTLSARYYKDGSEILVSRGPRRNPRRLTPRECARLMGFPDSFEIPVSDTQAYKQFGNSVVVPVIETVANAIRPHLVALRERSGTAKRQMAMVV